MFLVVPVSSRMKSSPTLSQVNGNPLALASQDVKRTDEQELQRSWERVEDLLISCEREEARPDGVFAAMGKRGTTSTVRGVRFVAT